jgi:hypothetical protein
MSFFAAVAGYSTPVSTPLVADPDVPACAAEMLVADVTSSNALAGGQLIAWISFANTSSKPCGLSLPGVRFIDPAGRPIELEISQSADCSNKALDACIFPKPILMAPGLSLPKRGDVTRPAPFPGEAGMEITWRERESDGTACSSAARAVSLDLDLPDGGGIKKVDLSTDLLPNGIAPCHEVMISSFLGVAGQP